MYPFLNSRLFASASRDAAKGAASLATHGGSGEALASAASSRRSFLHRSGLSVVAAGAVAAASGSSAFGQAMPKEKVRTPSKQRSYFESIQMHESDHVDFLVAALGADARPKPTFMGLEQPKVLNFVLVSQALENTGVGAYLAALPLINSMEYTAAAGSIATVEARHAGFLNSLINDPVTGNALDNESDPSFEVPLTIEQVAAAAGPFIQDLNGGPPLTFSTTPSAENDIAILNFALALEYLEAEFYDVNVPKFYKVRTPR